MKQKLLLALLALFTLGGSNLYAQTTWTGDITNADGLSFTQQYVGLSDGDVAETWKGNIGTDEGFDLNQSLTNVPDGVYELSAQAMYRASLTYGTTTNCVLYATVGETTFSTPIANFGDYTSKEDRTATGGIATQMQNNNAYLNIVPAVIVEGGTVTIGMKSIGELTYCTNGYWFVFKKSTFTFKNVTTGYHAKLVARANTMLATAPDSEAKTALSNAVTTNADANLANVKALQAAINTFLATATSENPLNVTDYITNPSFSDDSGNKKNWIQDLGYKQPSDIYQPTGWNMLYSSAKVNNTQYQTYKTQTDGAKDNNCYYVRQRWGDVYAVVDLHQLVKELPSGAYRLTVAVKGGSSVTDANSLGMKAGNNSNTTSVGDFDKSNYKDYSVQVNKADADTDIDISFGWNQQTGGEQLYYVDDFRLYYLGDPLKAAQSNWQEVHDALAALDATALPRAAKEAITTELENSVPTTSVDDVNSAIAALQALIDSYDGIKAAFDEYKALKAKVEDLKNASKYNFTGDEALSTFNSTLTEIDGNAENATDAETLTALLPDLRTAGNTFVGGIESNDGFDVTYNVINNSFETGALDPWNANSANDTGVKPNNDNTYTTNDVDGDYLFNTWGGSAEKYVKQTLSNLPEGYYTVTASVASDEGLKVTLFAGTAEIDQEVSSEGKGQFVDGTTPKKFVASNASLEIGAKSTSWYKVDNFRLTFYTAKSVAREAWQDAHNAAQAAYENDKYAAVTGEEKTNLKTEIDKAEPTSAEGYNEAVEALQYATNAFTNAKEAYETLIANKQLTQEELPYASSSKYDAINDAKNVTPTNAADATTKANAIISTIRAYVESNAMAEGVDGAEDYTSAIEEANADQNKGWTNGIGTNQGEGYTDAEGQTASKYLDGGWSGSAAVNIDMTREVTVPAGKYVLSVTARGAVDLTTYTMSIAGNSVGLPHHGSSNGVFGNGWDDAYVVFDSEGEPLTLEIKARSEATHQWISLNRFRLVQIEKNLNVYAGDTEYTALNNAIATAEAMSLGFEAEEYAPYNNIEALEALAAAKAIDQTAVETNLKTTVNELTKTLNDAIWTVNTTDVDAIYNGNFAEANGTNPKGWTRSNNGWGQQITGLTPADNGVNEGTTTAWYYNTNAAWQYGNDGVYTMPLAANQAYVLSFKYSKHGNDWQTSMTASVTNTDNEGLKVAQFPGADNGTTFQSVKAYFTTGAAGNYILSIEQNGNAHLTDVSLVKAESATKNFDEASTTYTPELAYYETVSLTRSLQAGDKWNTFCVPFDMEIPDGWTVKEFDSAEGNTINFKNAESIVAGNPYIVKLDEAVTNPTYSNKVVKSTEGKIMGQGEYKFAAQIYNKSLETDGSIAYMTTSGQIKKLTSGGIKGLRAYFIIPANGESARIHFVEEDETTGIDAIDGVIVENGNIYDLQGRKVETMKRGIYIVNGKKVVIK